MSHLKAANFDWGDTVMRDFPDYDGPMAAWPRVEAIPGVADVLALLSDHMEQNGVDAVITKMPDLLRVLPSLETT